MKKWFSTFDVCTYEDYVDYCELNDIEPQGEDSEVFYNFVNDELSLSIEDEFANLEYEDSLNVSCVITGTLGLWNGRHDIYAVPCDCVYDAFRKCIDKCNDFEIYIGNGEIWINSYHHDGTNRFVINMLSECGKRHNDEIDTLMELPKSWIKKFPSLNVKEDKCFLY